MTVRISILGGEGGAAERAGDQLTAAGFLLAPLAEGEVILQMLRWRATWWRPSRGRTHGRPSAVLSRFRRAATGSDHGRRPGGRGGLAGAFADGLDAHRRRRSSASELALPVLRALGEVDYDADGLSRRKFVASQFESFKSWVTERITLEELWGGSTSVRDLSQPPTRRSREKA